MSIETAHRRAAEAGVGDRVAFAVASAKGFEGRDYDLICFFDCLHDMGDPVGAAGHALAALKPDGTVLLVEPFAGDDLAENANPVGRLYYTASTFICTPNSLSQEVGLAWAPRPVKRGCAACSPKRNLPGSGARRRRRSTWCWRRGRSRPTVLPSHRTQGAGPALTTRLDAGRAVQGWPFVPARRGTDAVDAWVVIQVVFRLEQRE
jgi:hypothetical protein